MRSQLPILPLLFFPLLFQSCHKEAELATEALPLSGGIQLSLHTTGGSTGMNECIQISDHWQLSSVGRRHGWIRKLEPDEQRMLVRAMQGFETLVWKNEADPKSPHHTSSILTAKGSGEGLASKEEAANLDELVQKLINAKRIASR